jgi:apolipoprotein D and lipocalin family protein
MQFVIAYVSDDYRHTIVARERLDFVWIMSSEPSIESNDYNRLVERVARIGYNPAHLRVVPQQKTGRS